jgi:hypothetical protein
MQQEMGAAMAQLTAQRQAAAQAFNGTNEAWDAQFGQVLRPDGADAAAKARESMQGPD